MRELLESRVARSDDGGMSVYYVAGSGPVDLVCTDPGLPVELLWDDPGFSRTFTRLASFCRVLILGGRREGDPRAQYAGEVGDEDLFAVMDSAKVEKAVLVGWSLGGWLMAHFAAMHPERVDALILINSCAHYVREDDYPWGFPRERLDDIVAFLKGSWDNSAEMGITAPSRIADERFQALWGRARRSGNSPTRYAESLRLGLETDVRAVLPSISVRSLVLHREGDRFIYLGAGRYLAEHIPGAKLVVLPGDDHMFFVGDSDSLVDEIEEFLTGARSGAEGDVLTMTVLFTDIVASTERQAHVSPREWSRLTDHHDAMVRSVLGRHRGHEVKTTGDGFLATFDATGRALRCATDILAGAKDIGLDLRAGVHTGEVEVRGDDIAGMAVTIAKRVCDLAGPGQVMVSETVRGQVVGAGIEFEDHGEHQLKGVPGTWRLFTVVG